MHIIGFSIFVQLLCAVHCARNSRNGVWMMVIVFLSIPGCLAYAFFEILPSFVGGRQLRAAKQSASRILAPERKLRAARDALDLADTASNCIALGDALVEIGREGEATEYYRAGLEKMPRPDRGTKLKLATVLLETGCQAEALSLLQSLPGSVSVAENDRASLLLARALQANGDVGTALQLYEDLGRRLPGGEAQCRRAELLLQLDRRFEGEAVLAEVEQLSRRLDRQERNRHKDMYAWASRTLAELRAK